MRLIQSRTDEVGHTGIHYGKLFCLSFFDVQHLSNQTAALCHHRTPGFDMQPSLTGLYHPSIPLDISGKIRYRFGLRLVIIDTKPASHIYNVRGIAGRTERSKDAIGLFA